MFSGALLAVGLCWAGFYLRCCYFGSNDVGVLSWVDAGSDGGRQWADLALAGLAATASSLALPPASHWGMSQGPSGHAADEAEEIKDRLADGAPAFSLWKRSELPAEWRRSCTAGQVCVALELPDTPWGRTYYKWACLQLEVPSDENLPVMLASMYDFRGEDEHGRRASAAMCLRSLLATGKPPAHFARILETSQ